MDETALLLTKKLNGDLADIIVQHLAANVIQKHMHAYYLRMLERDYQDHLADLNVWWARQV
jgi:hypothetical protein